jgi:N-acyl-D-aspartate/D-glutamate deacylase
MGNVELFLREVREAQGKGVDVTVGVLPYNAGSTAIGAAVFSRDWQTIFDISYEDVEWAATGERFDKVMWEKYREEQPSGAVIHHYLREEWTRRALQEPGSIVVSDLIPMKSLEEKVPPHNGAFSKILARYVREQNALDLMDALGKMTVLPARRLQNYAPAFARKGRVQPGMDADLVIFDPDLIEDRASYRDPYQTALGIEHVVVAGIPVISNAKLLPNASPGRYLSAKNQLD